MKCLRKNSEIPNIGIEHVSNRRTNKKDDPRDYSSEARKFFERRIRKTDVSRLYPILCQFKAWECGIACKGDKISFWEFISSFIGRGCATVIRPNSSYRRNRSNAAKKAALILDKKPSIIAVFFCCFKEVLS